MLQRLTIIGVGLIGGSLARAARRGGAAREIVGWGQDLQQLRRAMELGVIDLAAPDLATALAGADIVVLATPVPAMGPLLAQMAGLLEDGMAVTDVGSVKGPVVQAARAALGARFGQFVPGHPIAGDERAGVEASRADLFQDHAVILTPGPDTDPAALAAVRRLWEAAGARVMELDADHHDRVLAATSHLPHALAYTLVDSLVGGADGEEILRYAAGGFRDFTRIASSNPAMWRDISLANRDHLLAVLRDFDAHLHRVMAMLEAGDAAALGEVFARAKAARDRFKR